MLLEARARGTRLASWPAQLMPHDQLDAERIREAMAAGFEQPLTGWKIGAMDPATAVKRGLERPFCGRIPATLIYPSGARIVWQALLRPVVEAEIAFKIACDLPARAQPYSDVEVAAAVAAVAPAIEIPESRLRDGHPLGALGMVADQGFAGRLATGEWIRDWRGLDLASVRVVLRIGTGSAVLGTGVRAMGHPLHALAWLVEFLRERGCGLKAGEVVSTGSLTGVQETRPGDRVSATFEALGDVWLEMV